MFKGYKLYEVKIQVNDLTITKYLESNADSKKVLKNRILSYLEHNDISLQIENRAVKRIAELSNNEHTEGIELVFLRSLSNILVV